MRVMAAFGSVEGGKMNICYTLDMVQGEKKQEDDKITNQWCTIQEA